VPEMAAKPVSQMSFTSVQNAAQKAIGEVVLSDELLKLTVPAADLLFQVEMQKAVALATDTRLLAILFAGSGSSHASTGLTAAQFLADFSLALQSIQTEASSKLYLVLPINTYKVVRYLRDTGGLLVGPNGKIGDVTVIATSGAGTNGYMLNAGAIGADSDLLTVEVSRHATVEMADNPTAGDYHLLSLFQNNLTMIRAERFFGVVVMRPTGVATITGYS